MAVRVSPRAMEVLLAFYFLEAGAFLLLTPWSRLWALKLVLEAPEGFQGVLVAPSLRGLVSGLGILHLVYAYTLFRGASALRPSRPAQAAVDPAPGAAP